MRILENAGRRMVFWGSIVLMSWALYEFIVMFGAMFGLIRTIFEISASAQYPISNAISIMMKNSGTQFLTLLFLLCCILLGLYALLTRRRPVLCFFDIPLSVLFSLYILGRTTLASANLLQKLKLIPFALIGVGGLICFIFALRQRLNQRKNRRGDPPPTRPYDPFRIKQP